MTRNTDKLIDEAMVEKISGLYDSVFNDWTYVCTWDFLDYKGNDFRVGMCCYTTDRDNLESVEKAIKYLASELGLDDPVSIHYNDSDKKQKDWLQPINLVLPEKTDNKKTDNKKTDRALKVKEIYKHSEDSNFLSVRVITKDSLKELLQEAIDDSSSDDIDDDDCIVKENFSLFYEKEIVHISQYGHHWEWVINDMMGYMTFISELFFGDIPDDMSAEKMYKQYSDFCKRHTDKGHILLIG